RRRTAVPAGRAHALSLGRGGARRVVTNRPVVPRYGTRPGSSRRRRACRRSLQPRACGPRADRTLAAASAAEELPDHRIAHASGDGDTETRAPRAADAAPHAAAVAAVRIRTAGFPRTLDVRRLYRHAARDRPAARGRRRIV